MNEKPKLTFWQIWNMSFGFLGIQYGFGLQQANMSPIFRYLGADEASIYCSSYAIGTLEYRFLFEQNSNFILFVDQGWWEDQSQEQLVTDDPLGFGAGTSFETKAGIFSLTYALGQQYNNPIEFRGGKVHFGFTSLF